MTSKNDINIFHAWKHSNGVFNRILGFFSVSGRLFSASNFKKQPRIYFVFWGHLNASVSIKQANISKLRKISKKYEKSYSYQNMDCKTIDSIDPMVKNRILESLVEFQLKNG